MSALYSAVALVLTLASAGVQHHNHRQNRKQAERFHNAEQKRLNEQAEQARIAHNIGREHSDNETASIQDGSSAQLVSTGRRKRNSSPSGNISSSLGL